MIRFDKTRLSSTLALLVSQRESIRKLPDEEAADFVKRIVRAYCDEHDRHVAESWSATVKSISDKTDALVASWAKALAQAKKPKG